MRAVVTGGAGFIGSRISSALMSVGYDVLVVDDLSSGSADAVPDGAGLATLDVSEVSAAAEIVAWRPSLVVHAAAQISVPRSVEDPALDRRVNVEGTRRVVEAAVDAGSDAIVFLSSGGAIYGNADGATERTAPRPLSPYGVHKLQAEELVRRAPIAAAVLRLANVYGPGQRVGLEGGVVAAFVDAARHADRLTIHGTGRQRRDFVHVDDLVRAALLAARSGGHGTWNVGTGVSTSIGDLAELIRQRAGRPIAFDYAPAREGDVDVSCLRIDAIRRDLGWTPTISLVDGIDALLDAREPVS